jgi:soluble lytic murein transglycosylase
VKSRLLLGLVSALGPGLFGLAGAAIAASDTLVAPALMRTDPAVQQTANGGMMSPDQRQAYSAIFDAIRGGRWSEARAGLYAQPDGVLTPVATAELFLARNSPRIERDELVALINKAPDLPQAPQLILLARKRGAPEAQLPALPAARDLDHVNGSPRRLAARATAGDLAADQLAVQARPLLKADKPADAEALLNAAFAQLTPEARTEWQQRIAWSFYQNGDDADANRLSTIAASGPGDWSVQASWVRGLSAWRVGDCKIAEGAFSRVAGNASDDEMRAAGLFWSARANMACGRFDKVQAQLRSGARNPETFYGLIAARLLGLAVPPSAAAPRLTGAEWNSLSTHADVRRAAALAEIGEYGLADEMLRWQARIGTDGDHKSLLHLAARLDLPATQIWLAHNCPAGEVVEASARYPAPNWVPQGGWKVDKALVFAHALQESRFRTDAVSGAGARGLMQVLPTTADLIDRRQGTAPSGRTMLGAPSVNMAYGQTYLAQLAAGSGTGGLLPKVIAAYNAGPNAVARWNLTGPAAKDPLLYIESIPYAETRAYVATVLRNYWMYEQQSGEKAASLKAIAQGVWPRFPTDNGATRTGVASVGDPATGVRRN